MQGVFRIHRTLFACCTTNNRYDRSHGAALPSHVKEALISRMHAGAVIVQTASRAASSAQLGVSSSEGGSLPQLLALLLASRRAHWHSSAFLIAFSRPHAASDGSTALIAVNITQQLLLHECAAAMELQRMCGVRCTVYRGGPCKSTTPMAILSADAAAGCDMLLQQAAAVHHPNLVHSWQRAQPPCCFYRWRAQHRCRARAALTQRAAASCATWQR
jgi:hypothetical protein